MSLVLIILPVSAGDGYTQGWLGAPDWVLNRVDTDILPDFYYPRNIPGGLDEIPTVSSSITRGNELLISGSYIESKRYFEEAIQLDPRSFDAWLGRAYALEKTKRYQSALESYHNAVSYSDMWDSTWPAYAGIGRTSLALGQYQAAESAFQEALILLEDSGNANLEDITEIDSGLTIARENLGEFSGY